MPATKPPLIEVVRVGDAIADALAVFFHEAWGDTSDGHGVREARRTAAASNPVVPGADIPAAVLVKDGKVLGYFSTIPASFWNGTSEFAGHWTKGLMVLPEARNGPVGFLVMKELMKHLEVACALPVVSAARRLFEALGFVDCGTIANYVSLLRPARVAGRLDIAHLGLGFPKPVERAVIAAQSLGIASIGGVVMGLAFAARRTFAAGTGFTVECGGALPPTSQLDDLWQRARTGIGAGAVRNGAMLSWRYAPSAGGLYEAATVRTSAGTLAAVAIVRRPKDSPDQRLRGISVATLSDIVFATNEPGSGLAAVRGAERVARRMGADALVCSCTHPAVADALRRRAFVQLPGNLHLMVRDPKGAATLSTTLRSWWVTRGDASSDEMF